MSHNYLKWETKAKNTLKWIYLNSKMINTLQCCFQPLLCHFNFQLELEIKLELFQVCFMYLISSSQHFFTLSQTDKVIKKRFFQQILKCPIFSELVLNHYSKHVEAAILRKHRFSGKEKTIIYSFMYKMYSQNFIKNIRKKNCNKIKYMIQKSTFSTN